MGTNIMTSRFPPEQFVSRLPFAIALLCAVPSCDEAANDDAFALRSIDASDQADVDPSAVDDIKGAPDITCPQCGSQWTHIGGGDVVIFLTRKFGNEMVPLADDRSAEVFLGERYGKVYFDLPPDEDGYKLLMRNESVYDGASLLPAHRPEIAVVRFGHDTSEVDIRLPFVSNEECAFAMPDL